MDHTKIPPIQMPITTIETNVMQTPQTPLDQKVSLTKPTKASQSNKKTRKKDQVSISEQQWGRLKERKSLEQIREMQQVMLFNHLLQQGLSQLQACVTPLLHQVTSYGTQHHSTRQDLSEYYQQQLRTLEVALQPIEQQLAHLMEAGVSNIEVEPLYWVIHTHQYRFPVQFKLKTLVKALTYLTFPESEAQQDALRAKEQLLERKRQQLTQLKQTLAQTRQQLLAQKDACTVALNQKNASEARLESLKQVLAQQTSEQASIRRKVAHLARIHPLKRNQSLYQATLLREQLMTQEQRKAQTAVQENHQILQAQHTEWHKQHLHYLATVAQVEQQQKAVATAENTYHTEKEQFNNLSETLQATIHQSCSALAQTLTHYVHDLYEEQAKTIWVAHYFRKELANHINELVTADELLSKKSLEIRSEEEEIFLTQQPLATLLSQANAFAYNVQRLLAEKT